MRGNRFEIILAAFLLVSPIGNAQSASARATGRSNRVDARQQELKDLIAEEWEFEMRESPLSATSYGDYRYNDKIDDISATEQLRVAQKLNRFLAQLQAVDARDFPEQERLNKTLLIRRIQYALTNIALKNYEMPLDQFNGIHLILAGLPEIVPTDSAKHYRDYLARLRQIPATLDQAIALARLGGEDHLMPPKFILEHVATQCDSIAAPAGEKNSFAAPLRSFPDAISAQERQQLHDEIVKAIDTEVRPAYSRLSKFVKEEYAPEGRKEPGIWALPDGDGRYRAAVREMTTTDMTPQQIYDLGMAQVRDTEAQMDVIARQQGFSDWKSYGNSLHSDPKMTAASREQVLDTYRKYIAQMEPKLPEFFGILPKAHVEVVPVETYREKEAPGAEYQPGTPDGSRRGQVFVNTGDFEHRSLPEMEAVAYHEGIPGHHMQFSIAEELPDLPAFRQHSGYSAFAEGWALYAERLGKEVGFYQVPANDFERLGSELFRATRLVEDTGVHYKHWTRDQMVQFFHENSLESEADLQAETDRYIVWPGQALSYKIGQLKFLELRERARRQLGDKFDIRAFHDEMLDGGAMPLDILEQRTNDWIVAVEKGQSTGRDR
ncbi:MAG TPA: DUF885 domain-containing protein [Candidatus Acidoferrum sp.]|nr:DUF885 domain-containing protein [Candidatus Acidoferrum sp.]